MTPEEISLRELAMRARDTKKAYLRMEETSSNPRYPVVLRPLSEDDGGGWIAVVPDLPGCMSDGTTGDEAFRNVLDAIESWESSASEEGQHQ